MFVEVFLELLVVSVLLESELLLMMEILAVNAISVVFAAVHPLFVSVICLYYAVQ